MSSRDLIENVVMSGGLETLNPHCPMPNSIKSSNTEMIMSLEHLSYWFMYLNRIWQLLPYCPETDGWAMLQVINLLLQGTLV